MNKIISKIKEYISLAANFTMQFGKNQNVWRVIVIISVISTAVIPYIWMTMAEVRSMKVEYQKNKRLYEMAIADISKSLDWYNLPQEKYLDKILKVAVNRDSNSDEHLRDIKIAFPEESELVLMELNVAVEKAMKYRLVIGNFKKANAEYRMRIETFSKNPLTTIILRKQEKEDQKRSD